MDPTQETASQKETSDIVLTTRRIYGVVEDIATRLGVVLTPLGESPSAEPTPPRSQAVDELTVLETRVLALYSQIDV